MRYPAAYYLLLLYSTVLMRCVLPVTCDALSHVFNEEKHLATIHAVYGSHHLQSEMAGTVAQSDTGKHTASLQENEPTVVHTFTQTVLIVFTSFLPNINHSTLFSFYFPLRSSDCITPPPERC